MEWFINNKPRKKVYNVCSGKVYDRKSLAEKIVKASGKKLDIEIETKGLDREYSGNNSLLLDEIKNFEFTPIGDSIKKLYWWYEQNKQVKYEYL